MEIHVIKKETEVRMELLGRLDTNAAPRFSEKTEEYLTEEVEKFVLDMSGCDYVASSGLRVILSAQKKMNALSGKMTVINVDASVMEVFEMVGFSDILTFE